MDATAPGVQPVLFPAGSCRRWTVHDNTGRPVITARTLGIAVTVARRLAALNPAGSWIVGDDGTHAHLTDDTVTVTGPARWAESIRSHPADKEHHPHDPHTDHTDLTDDTDRPRTDRGGGNDSG